MRASGSAARLGVVRPGQSTSTMREAALASSWTGVYDVTPDWNPLLGPVEELLGPKPDVSLAPYALSRFRRARLLTGRYGREAVS